MAQPRDHPETLNLLCRIERQGRTCALVAVRDRRIHARWHFQRGSWAAATADGQARPSPRAFVVKTCLPTAHLFLPHPLLGGDPKLKRIRL